MQRNCLNTIAAYNHRMTNSSPSLSPPPPPNGVAHTRPNTLKFLFAHPAHFIALAFGAGLAPFAAGTFGTLAAVPIYWALALVLPPYAIALLCVPLFFLGVWACDITAKNIKIKDPNCICIDELVAVLPLLALTHQSIILQAIAVISFRVFDILKPWPVSLADRKIEGGFGVMMDDLFAACYAYLIVIAVVIAQTKFGFKLS
jgi:phosphatidylglycerophosphatase A